MTLFHIERSLEVKEQHNDWTVHSTIVDSLSCTLKDLQPGRAYRFRVRAENCHGCSEPSSPTDEVCISLADSPIDSTQNNRDTASDDDVECESERMPPSVREGGDFKARFETFEELGKGRFGVVYRCVERETGTLLAAKIVKCIRSADKMKVGDCGECELLRTYFHVFPLPSPFDRSRKKLQSCVPSNIPNCCNWPPPLRVRARSSWSWNSK